MPRCDRSSTAALVPITATASTYRPLGSDMERIGDVCANAPFYTPGAAEGAVGRIKTDTHC
jgi:hypothetical protein